MLNAINLHAGARVVIYRLRHKIMINSSLWVLGGAGMGVYSLVTIYDIRW